MLAKYDPRHTWDWNLTNAPEVLTDTDKSTVPLPGNWKWCGLSLNSPLGISAGPLLNSRWLLYYADLDFDILVYKTVRSLARACYPLPNLLSVDVQNISTPGTTVVEAAEMNGTWAVSFGMPSLSPEAWRADVQVARDGLPCGKVLVVSVVGTQDSTISDAERSLEHLAADFARCAKWAIESGAHGVEANFSCPNVSTNDGQLYQQPESAGFVAAQIREQIGSAPLVLKIGYVPTKEAAQQLVSAVSPYVNGLAMTNSITARVTDSAGRLLFDGSARGICGGATRVASVAQVRMFRNIIERERLSLDLIGVGGISNDSHVRAYLDAGADTVALATAAMTDPDIALRIRKAW